MLEDVTFEKTEMGRAGWNAETKQSDAWQSKKAIINTSGGLKLPQKIKMFIRISNR